MKEMRWWLAGYTCRDLHIKGHETSTPVASETSTAASSTWNPPKRLST